MKKEKQKRKQKSKKQKADLYTQLQRFLQTSEKKPNTFAIVSQPLTPQNYSEKNPHLSNKIKNKNKNKKPHPLYHMASSIMYK